MATQFWGWALLLIAILATVTGRLPKARNWLYLIAGFILAATFGAWLVSLLIKGIGLSAPLLARIKGFHPEYLLPLAGVALLFLAVHSLHPKKGKPAKWHGPVFFLAAALLFAIGGAFGQVATAGSDLVTTVVG